MSDVMSHGHVLCVARRQIPCGLRCDTWLKRL